ncbi:hypothetical protein KZ829_41425 [Actinoplanes hulinensis]|uniref:Uncharacterized protein n=1 Tax=Actinoplanes hulinensis TaxID=1144547 RepID=A0ABS7BH59_9ACTN|nr:hypothetical protein [Actinoplanes hulinensis]MBW6440206.1 hypothetical protein [Actinoplanes hulinensis]
MRLIDTAGHELVLRVVGYQSPEAEDLRLRNSWHMLEGTAATHEGSWSFRYPALTCDESPMVSTWLRNVAGSLTTGDTTPDPRRPVSDSLSFVEPNLALRFIGEQAGLAEIEIMLDLEFKPPWRPDRHAGAPLVLRYLLLPGALERAAADWDREVQRYPDRSAE